MAKSPDAFRTISEVAEWLGVPTHVLRFWESRFTQIKPVKRAGGRRYYRPSDMELLGGIKRLLHHDGLTIRGVQKLLREEGVAHVAALSPGLEVAAAEPEPARAKGTGRKAAAPPKPRAAPPPEHASDGSAPSRKSERGAEQPPPAKAKPATPSVPGVERPDAPPQGFSAEEEDIATVSAAPDPGAREAGPPPKDDTLDPASGGEPPDSKASPDATPPAMDVEPAETAAKGDAPAQQPEDAPGRTALTGEASPEIDPGGPDAPARKDATADTDAQGGDATAPPPEAPTGTPVPTMPKSRRKRLAKPPPVDGTAEPTVTGGTAASTPPGPLLDRGPDAPGPRKPMSGEQPVPFAPDTQTRGPDDTRAPQATSDSADPETIEASAAPAMPAVLSSLAGLGAQEVRQRAAEFQPILDRARALRQAMARKDE